MPTPKFTPAQAIAFLNKLEAFRVANPDIPIAPTVRGDSKSLMARFYKHLAETENMSPNTSRGRITKIRNLFPTLLPHWFNQAITVGGSEKPAHTLKDDVQLHRYKSTNTELGMRLKMAHEEISALEDALRDYERIAKWDVKEAEWTVRPSMYTTQEHTPYLLTSDMQIGEVIKKEETDAFYGYDVEAFIRRYQRMIDTTIELCFKHQSGWTFPGIIYARGGDTISGGIHEELEDTDELTPIQAVMLAVEQEKAGILRLAEAFGRVEVKEIGGGGNHDRTTKKPRSKRRPEHSYDTLIGWSLRRELANDSRITFQGSKSPDCRFKIYNTRILLTHGDNIGTSGGQGFVGPELPILRGAQKVIAEQLRLGHVIDQVHMGHFHTSMAANVVISNGSFPGYSEFAKRHRMRPELPSQWLLFYHPLWGIADWKKIYLETPLQE